MAKTNVVLKSVWDDKGIKQAKKEFADFGKSIGVAFAAVGAATLAGAAALARFGGDAIAAAENVQQANNRLTQVNKSMGLFGAETANVTNRLIKFAEANELTVAVDAEVIKATQAKLLTFKELGQTADEAGGAFDRATLAALDLAAAGFGSAESNAIQLGKALQDPIKGLTALRRAGVTFTEAEKDKIRTMVESGNVLEAQNLILSAIETQVGGTAAATAKASDVMKLAFDNVSEAVGAALLPTFQEFADEIVKFTPTLEETLAPAAGEIAQIFKNEVLPAVQDFTKWLGSPEGVETIREFAQAIIDSIKNLIDFIGWVVKNRDALGLLIATIGILIVTFKTVTAVTALYNAALVLYNAKVVTATGTTTAFATAMKAIPWVAIIGGATWFISTMSDYADEVYGSKINTEGLTEAQAEQARKIEGLRGLLDQYKFALENGTEANKELARDGIFRVEKQLESMGVTTAITRSEIERMNRLKLDALRKEVGDTSGEMRRFADLASGINLRAGNPPVTTTTTTTTPFGGGGGNTRKNAFEETQKAIKETQKKIRDATARFEEAELKANEQYRKTNAEITKRYTDAEIEATKQKNEALAKALVDHNKNVSRIQQDFAQRQAEIIRTSINRLRDAFAATVRVNVADLFGQEQIGKSVDKLITSLRDRLTASRNLVANAAKLASGGFSQTFIEQVVGAGLETGNELSKAILEATPETQRELQSLFGALESESETGMDSLAQTMFEKTGLATTELKKLFTQTQTDLAEAIKQAQADYTNAQAEIQTTFTNSLAAAQKTRDEAFADATEKLNEALKDAKDAYVKTLKEIREAFDEQIAAMKGQLGGLSGVIQQLLAQLAALTGAKITAPKLNIPASQVGNIADLAGFEQVNGVNVAAKQLGNAVGILIDDAGDVSETLGYLDTRIKAALTYADNIGKTNAAAAESARQTAMQFTAQRAELASLGASAVGTVININVKADSTQSLAMVGKTLGNTITKYTSSGGQVLVSPK